jgi:hypothetical protein
MDRPMSRRYTYQSLTGRQLSDGLDEVGLTLRQFCRISGADERRVQRWISGQEPDIPMWVGSLLTALTVPAAMARVKAYADAVVTDVRQEKPDA